LASVRIWITSPDCTGNGVKHRSLRSYRGSDIVLPGDPTQIIRAADHPALLDQIGHDIGHGQTAPRC